MNTPAIFQAMIIADSLYKCDTTNKWTILGTFDTLGAKVYPFTRPLICVFAAITGCRGQSQAMFRFVKSDENDTPIQDDAIVTISSESPLTSVELWAIYRDVEFHEAGEYRIQLYHDGVFLAERRLHVVDVSGA